METSAEKTILRDTKYLEPRVRDFLEYLMKRLEREGLPFKIFETGRLPQRQEFLFKNKMSKTLQSKHLIEVSGNVILKFSLAVDLVLDLDPTERYLWSWANVGDKKQQADDLKKYQRLAEIIKEEDASQTWKKSGIISIVSGGNWKQFKDFPHIEFQVS